MHVQRTGAAASNESPRGQSTAINLDNDQDSKLPVIMADADVSITGTITGQSYCALHHQATCRLLRLGKEYRTSTAELWSYYLYLAANSGATLSNFAPTAFQNLLSQAAGDAGVLPFAGRRVY